MMTLTWTLLFLVLRVGLEATNLANRVHPLVHVGLTLGNQVIRPLGGLDVEHKLILLLAILKSQPGVNLQ